jgi:hypothetical protein
MEPGRDLGSAKSGFRPTVMGLDRGGYRFLGGRARLGTVSETYSNENAKVKEYLYRRIDLGRLGELSITNS